MRLVLAAFVDVSPEETEQRSLFESTLEDVIETSSSKGAQHVEVVTSCDQVA